MKEIESVGKYIKRERESRKISLGEVAKNTKVKQHILRAIEEDQYGSLPSPTYVKGFLLAYAKYLGLDPNDVLLRYESTLKGETITHPEVPTERKIGWSKKYLWMIGGMVILCLIVSYFLFLSPYQLPTEPVSVKPKVEEPLPPSPLPSPPKIADATSPQEEEAFVLQLKAIEETWVRINIDDRPDREMTLKPGESTSHKAQNRIQLLVGNAGGLDLILKGKILEKFGKSGEVVTLIVTPQGVEVKRR